MGKHDLSLRSLYGDGWSVPAVDEADFIVLRALNSLGGEANGLSILHQMLKWLEHPPVALLVLQSLQSRQFVTSSGSENDFKRMYQITEYGDRALRRAIKEGKHAAVEALAAKSRHVESAEDLLEGGLPERPR